MQVAAHAFGVQITIGAPRFPLRSAPAGERTECLSGIRSRGDPETLPTRLQLHPGGHLEPILKIGAPKKGGKIDAPVLGLPSKMELIGKVNGRRRQRIGNFRNIDGPLQKSKSGWKRVTRAFFPFRIISFEADFANGAYLGCFFVFFTF